MNEAQTKCQAMTGPQDSSPRRLVLILLTAIVFLSLTEDFAQQIVSGSAQDFSFVDYYPAPNQTQIQSRLSGAEASPVPGGLLEIKQCKLELFSTNGQPQASANAPECTYDMNAGVARSAGPLFLQNGDGTIRVQGVGFLWRRADSFLIISNEQKTVIENGMISPVSAQNPKQMP